MRRSNRNEHTGSKALRQPGSIILTLGLLLLAGCVDKPYLRTDYFSHQEGLVQVCYDPDVSNPKQAQQLAETVCKRYDRTARAYLAQENQCSWAAPSLVTYICVARPGEHPPPLVRQKAPLRIEPSGVPLPSMEQVAPSLSLPGAEPIENDKQ